MDLFTWPWKSSTGQGKCKQQREINCESVNKLLKNVNLHPPFHPNPPLQSKQPIPTPSQPLYKASALHPKPLYKANTPSKKQTHNSVQAYIKTLQAWALKGKHGRCSTCTHSTSLTWQIAPCRQSHFLVHRIPPGCPHHQNCTTRDHDQNTVHRTRMGEINRMEQLSLLNII